MNWHSMTIGWHLKDEPVCMYSWDSETAGSSLSQLWVLWSLGFNLDDVVLVLIHT